MAVGSRHTNAYAVPTRLLFAQPGDGWRRTYAYAVLTRLLFAQPGDGSRFIPACAVLSPNSLCSLWLSARAILTLTLCPPVCSSHSRVTARASFLPALCSALIRFAHYGCRLALHSRLRCAHPPKQSFVG